MKWHLVNPVCLLSDCGQYTVAKFLRGALPPQYQAYRGKTFLHLADTAAECKQACEVDADGQLLQRV